MKIIVLIFGLIMTGLNFAYSQLNFECCSSSEKQSIFQFFETSGFCKIPISVIEDIVPPSINDKNNIVKKKSISSGIVFDYANQYVLIDGEIVDLELAYLNVLSELNTATVYISNNENICVSNLEFTEIQNSLNINGTLWFHIYKDEDQDYLYFKWKDQPNLINTFGLGHLCIENWSSDLIEQTVPCALVGKFKVDPTGEFIETEVFSNSSIVETGFSGNSISSYDFNHPDRDPNLACAWIENKINNPNNYNMCSDLILLNKKDQSFFDNTYNSIDGLEWKRFGSRHFYARKNSPSGEPMDFTFSTLIIPYDICGPSLDGGIVPGESTLLSQENISHFYTFKQNIAYNLFDFGNYMWAGAMKTLGFSRIECKVFADYNSIIIQREYWDSIYDQRAIGKGHDDIETN